MNSNIYTKLNSGDALLSRKEAANYLGLQSTTLEHDAVTKRRFKYIRVGGFCKYRKSDLDAFLSANVVGGVCND